MAARRILLGLLFLAVCVSGPGVLERHEAPVSAAPATRLEVLRDVVYVQRDGLALRLDAYLLAGPGPHPVVIYVHGGAWTRGTKSWEIGDLVLPHVPEAGFSVLSIEYRLAPQHPYPAAVDDVRAAVRYVRHEAARFRIDGDRIVLAGASAGGHLVSLVGGTSCNAPGGPHTCGLRGVISMAGVADLRSAGSVPSVRTFLGRRLDVEGPPLLAEASPITHVDRGDPPVLLVHGDGDARVPLRQSEEYLRSLQGAGVPSRLVVLPGGNHVANWAQIRSPNWKQEIVRFLNRYAGRRH